MLTTNALCRQSLPSLRCRSNSHNSNSRPTYGFNKHHPATLRSITQRNNQRTSRIPTIQTEAPTTENTPVTYPSPKPFTGWTKYWYPIAIVEYLDPHRPQTMELLGRHLVIWRDSDAQWRVFEDRCPHRAAPLSEGKIMEDGTLMCSYHGWRFEGETGKCTKIPQAASVEAEERACSAKRSCAKNFPVRFAQGYLWVWPESGPEAEEEADNTPLDLDTHLQAALDAGDKPITFIMKPAFRDVPYDFQTLVENVVDPAHVPFSHHGVQGNREKVVYGQYEMGLVDNPSRPNDITVTHTNPIFGPGATISFSPPCRVNYLAVNEKDCTYSSFCIYCIPTKPGHSRLLSFITTTRKLPAMFRFILKMPLWLDHTQIRNKVLDGDNVFLHYQEHFIQDSLARGDGDWRDLYHCPTKADVLVTAFKKWVDTAGQGGPFGPLYKRADYPKLITDHRVLLNRYDQHTKNCRHCMKALRMVERLKVIAAASAALAWGALIASGIIWLQNSKAGTAAVVLGGLTTKTSAAAMALVGTTFAFLWRVLEETRQSFYYVPYVHAEK